MTVDEAHKFRKGERMSVRRGSENFERMIHEKSGQYREIDAISLAEEKKKDNIRKARMRVSDKKANERGN